MVALSIIFGAKLQKTNELFAFWLLFCTFAPKTNEDIIKMKKTLLLLSLVLTALQGTAQEFDNLPTPVEEKVIDNTPDSIAKALMNRPAPGSTRQGQNPVLFLIGNSTMRNGTMGNGNNGQWGWGYFASDFFDGRKISVENQALSTRNFYTDLWPAIRQALKPGDWVIVSIGHNDKADFFDAKRARGVIDGVAEDTMIVGFNERKQIPDTVYSYGHYLRCYIRDIRQAGANLPVTNGGLSSASHRRNGHPISPPQRACPSSISTNSQAGNSTVTASGNRNIISMATTSIPQLSVHASMPARQPRDSTTRRIHY